MNRLLTRSGLDLARMIRRGEVRSVEVLEAHIRRIQEVNPRLNLMVRDRFALARQEAQAADDRIAAGETSTLPPYHGVPCTIKESISLAGMPHSAGLLARKDVIAPQDATVTARLRAAGAIPMGVTNTSELCMWMESANRVYGRSRNPYDPTRIVGGSSGGEGGIIGAGASPFGLGSDIGGSIRMPAFFNGVFGHKPTGGLVPFTGQYPPAEGAVRRYVTTGPLARRAADLMPILRLVAGPDGVDGGGREVELGDPATVDLSTLTVLDVPDNGSTPVSADLRQAQRRVVDWLERQGARVTHLQVGPGQLEGLRSSMVIWSSMVSASEGSSYQDLLANGGDFSLPWELLRSMWGGSPYTLPSLGLALLELVPKVLPGDTERFVRAGEALRDELADRLGPRGVMIFPPYASPAPRHVKPLLPPWYWVYTAIINVLELPSTQVPLGLNADGLPLGVQVVGLHDHDHVTIAVAEALEKGFGGWVMPPR